MAKNIVLALVILLAVSACVPEYAPVPEAKEPVVYKMKGQLPETVELAVPLPFTKVWQERSNQTILWGFDQQGRLVLLNSSAMTIVLEYEEDRLKRINDGARMLSFSYDSKNRLVGAHRGLKNWVFVYSSAGRLLRVENDEDVAFTYDSKGRLSSFAKDNGPSTEFVYDKFNRTSEMFRDSIRTIMHYDTEGRLALIERESDHLVVGYWKENLLSALSGTMHGLKESVNYGPTEITLVSNTEPNVFRSQYADEESARLDAFNTFLFCTRFRKLPVMFDGQSWVLYSEYLKGTVLDYVKTIFVCEYLS